MDMRVGLWRKLSTEELILLNYGAGEDSWESLGLQGTAIHGVAVSDMTEGLNWTELNWMDQAKISCYDLYLRLSKMWCISEHRLLFSLTNPHRLCFCFGDIFLISIYLASTSSNSNLIAVCSTSYIICGASCSKSK